VTASDDDRAALDLTRENARVAGVELALEQRDVRELTGEGPRFIVTNPPYGERLEADAAFYPQMAASLRKLRGHTVAILAGTPAVERAMGKPDRWQILFNGPLECRLLVYGL
jgi:23S rRNA G2445 N2-methylase RlmL